MQQLSRSLSANLAQLKDSFGQSADFYSKQVQLYGCPCAILLFDGMASLRSSGRKHTCGGYGRPCPPYDGRDGCPADGWL